MIDLCGQKMEYIIECHNNGIFLPYLNYYGNFICYNNDILIHKLNILPYSSEIVITLDNAIINGETYKRYSAKEFEEERFQLSTVLSTNDFNLLYFSTYCYRLKISKTEHAYILMSTLKKIIEDNR